MATVQVWPGIGINVRKEGAVDGVYYQPADIVERTTYVQRRIDQGDLFEYDPAAPPAYIPFIDEQSVLVGRTAYQLRDLRGRYTGATTTTTGRAADGDGGGAILRWNASDATADNGTTVFGSGTTGRWRVVGTPGGVAAITLSGLQVTELSSTPGSGDGEVKYCNGYYARGDGGGGEFYWEAGATDTPITGLIIAATGGRWKRVYSGAVNVKWFGALGNNAQTLISVTPYSSDGTQTQQTVDGNAINLAIRYLRSIGGGTLYVPRGTYRVWGNLEPLDPSIVSVRFIGDGDGVSIIKTCDTAPTNANGYGIFITGRAGVPLSHIDPADRPIAVEFENITLDGNSDVRAAPGGEYRNHGLALYGLVKTRLKSVSIINSPCDCLQTYYAQTNGGGNPDASPYASECRLNAESCVFDNSYRNTVTIASGQYQTYVGCSFLRGGQSTGGTSPRACLDIEPDTVTLPVEDVAFSACLFKNAGNALVSCSWAGRIQFDACKFVVENGVIANRPWPFVHNTSGVTMTGCEFVATDPDDTSYFWAYPNDGAGSPAYNDKGILTLRNCLFDGVGFFGQSKHIVLENVLVRNSKLPVWFDKSTGTMKTLVLRNVSLVNVVDVENSASGPLSALALKSSVDCDRLEIAGLSVTFDTTALPADSSFLDPTSMGFNRAFGVYINPTVPAGGTMKMANVSVEGFFRLLPTHFGISLDVNNYRDYGGTLNAPPADTAGTATTPGTKFYRNCTERGDA